MLSYKEQLKAITQILLKQEDNYGQIKEATDDLYDLFIAVSELQEDEPSRKDYYLPKGKAIGTIWAGRCVKEFLRTKRFVAGIFKAIKRAQEKFADTPIHILYAGTGPFGTLLIPLTSVFTSKEVKFTLLEINSDSIENLKRVIQALEVDEYVEEIIQCDATEYRADKSKPIHMIVTETMQNALKKEPQVAITQNLVPQMVEGGILIPQNIAIEAVLLDCKRDMDRMMGVVGADQDFCYPLKQIFEWNKDSSNREKSFQEIQVEIPSNIEKRYKRLSLFTNIQVFEDEKLTYMECSLNMPLKVMDIDWNDTVKKVGFQYIINENPGFAYTLV